MNALRACVVGLALAALAPPARADTVMGTRSESMEEREHDIRIVLAPGLATLTVRRTVVNGGERHDQAVFFIDVPQGAVANRLRTLGRHRGQPRWFEAELLDAETAAARYAELTGFGAATPKDPALLSWQSEQSLALQVFPVEPASRKTVEYRLVMPTTYETGRYRVVLPQLGTDTMPATVTLAAENRRDRLFVEDTPVASGTRIEVSGLANLALERTRAPTVDGGLAVVPIRGRRALVHVDFAARTRLGVVPDDARVIVAIDASTSIDATELTAAITATRAYLGHFVGHDARVAVLTFDREVHPGAFVPVATALADLAKLEPVTRNGSHVDRAIAHAAKMFAAEPGHHPRRLLVLTDTLVRDGLTELRLREHATSTRSIVHLATVSSDEDTLDRDDDHAWAEVARTTGGVFWHAGVVGDDPTEEDIVDRFEEWARPVRIDRLGIAAPGLEEMLEVLPALDEGEGVEALTFVPRGPKRVVLTGELWSEPIEHTLVPDRDLGTRWAALAIGSGLLGMLDDREIALLAMRGRVVSPRTSYLAIEPGVRPSTEGLEPAESGFGFGSGSGRVPAVRTARGMVSTGRRFDPDAFLRGEIRSALDTCGGTDRKAKVTLQTTVFEIVEVDAVALHGADDKRMRECLREGTWAVELPGEFADTWRRWELEI
jgi:hypothetical protein